MTSDHQKQINIEPERNAQKSFDETLKYSAETQTRKDEAQIQKGDSQIQKEELSVVNQPEEREYHLETLALHAGQIPDPSTRACSVPIYRTTAYDFPDSGYGADLFALRKSGNIYSRLMNPTNDVLEKRLAALDRGVAAVTFASGTAAIYFAVTNIVQCGDQIVAANNLYGGTFTQFDSILPRQGVQVRFTNVNDFEAVKAAINEKTRLIYIEAVGNPGLEIADIERYSAIAKQHHLPLMIDATFTTPVLLRPIEYGADLVIHSLSKWIGGHGAGIGGAVIDAGHFDWTDPKFALYNEPDSGYHGLRFALDAQGNSNKLAFSQRLRTVGLRNQGATLSPDSAWIFLQGVESLPVRMKKHSENALAVARFLSDHPKVDWVRYPGLHDDPIAKKYLSEGAGGMIVFGIKGDAQMAQDLVDRIALFEIVANVGDSRSLIIHPASTTHSQLSDEDQKKAGITPEMIRLSIGLEHVDDIIGALNDALLLES